MAGRAEEPRDLDPKESQEGHWRTAGDRIQTLLDASAAGGPAARERAEQLVREVVDLYGAGLGRIMAALDDPAAVDRLAADDLVASLLLVHGLHPHDVHRRVSDALGSVRPYLGSHGGDVELLEVAKGAERSPWEYTVRLQFSGSCKTCPSSSVTLELAVEDAVRAAAPEVTAIEVVAAEPAKTASVIPADSLLAKVRADGRGSTVWHPVPDLADLAPGEVAGFDVGGMIVLTCRVGDDLFAYRDHCPGCDDSLAGAALHRRMGAKDPVLRCPRCHAHYDVVHAGAGLDDGREAHLDPLPLLVRDGVLSIAVHAQPTGLSA
jgi:Fe-S cluster biogenesis protein NfuA/nitrite reductase/ring-hydroxylating ferredoxin subunit